MREIREMGTIQIDVTNNCNRSCSNCTRFCGHHKKEHIFFMEPEYYKKAVLSLVSYIKLPGKVIGMIGGEPTTHPKFIELCTILNDIVTDKTRKGLWSNLHPNFYKYRGIIEKTFGVFNLNNHVSTEVMHTPILVSSEDLIKEGRITEDEFVKFTNNCWVQLNWSATITPRGAYFCEVAGTLSYLFNGPDGLPITEDWWAQPLTKFKYQRDWACRRCGCQIPLKPRRSIDGNDDISKTNLLALINYGSPKIKLKRYIESSLELDYSQIRNNDWYWNRNQ